MAVFIGPDHTPGAGFGHLHPLGQDRQAAVQTLANLLGWLPSENRRNPQAASRQILERFHDTAYIDAIEAADLSGKVSGEVRKRFKIGTMENPIFRGLFARAATSVGGSILAAEVALTGQMAFHPAGGTHHGRRNHASGFCYFNDPVYAILTLLDAGIGRVGYVDLDAHHGDGVQDAFSEDDRVITVSIHEAGRWPGSGVLDDRAASGLARNAPVPAGFNDSELGALVSQGVVPYLTRMGVEAIVITSGADALKGDPLSRLEVSNTALWQAVEDVAALAPVKLVLGGGGYNPWTTTRAWVGLWGRLSGRDTAIPLPADAQDFLGGFSSDLVDEEDVEPYWITSLEDPLGGGVIRDEIKTILSAWEK